MELTYILFALSTISIFSSGYSCRRRYIKGVLISALVAQIPLYINVSTIGIFEYMQRFENTQLQSWTVAMGYIVFVWTIGYICGGINIKKKDNADDFPGKYVAYKEMEFD